jgi:methylated-DNA-[protein]-cysteine S-methyltransferase
MILWTELDAPVGRLLLASDGAALVGVFFANHRHFAGVGPAWRRDDGATPFAAARAQLRAYFDGELEEFDVPVAAVGTVFQHRVWRALRTIPFGSTTTYAALAAALDAPRTAARAVGAAVGRNPLSIIVPCHRVLGADGSLTGFAGGLDTKRALLHLEDARCLAADSSPVVRSRRDDHVVADRKLPLHPSA